MACKGICIQYPARRLSSPTISIYEENFRCQSCNVFVSPLGVEKNRGNQLVCKCCSKQVRLKAPRKLKPKTNHHTNT